MQKVVELTFKGIEIWFVLGAGDGDQSSLQAADAAPTPENLKKAGIASLKKGSRVRRFREAFETFYTFHKRGHALFSFHKA